jgi:hypothetical protein
MSLFSNAHELAVSFKTPLRVELELINPVQPPKTIWELAAGGMTIKGENMSSTMQAGSLAVVSVAWKDEAGNAAKVDGATTWKSSDESVVKATVSTGNSLICNLESPGKIGNASVQATADADLGDGVKTVTSVLEITVIGGEAVGGEITFKEGGSGPSSPGGGGGGSKPPTGGSKPGEGTGPAHPIQPTVPTPKR